MSDSKKKKLTLNANSLRIILLVIMVVIVGGGGAAVAFGLDTIRTYSIEVSHKKVDASASNGTIQALQKTQAYLDANQDVLQKAGLLRATSEFPEFKVVDEVRKVAAKNNVEVVSFTYDGQSSGTSGTSTTPSTTTPAPQATTSTPAAGTTESTATTSGDTISLSVTFKAPGYLEFLQFTYDLEQHLPKMKISGISASNGSGGTGGGSSSSTPTLTIDPITVEMYINK